jgi:uncharacterized protein YbbK (DUF523 family)
MSEHIIRIGISSCLLGQNVRYDGTHKLNAAIVEFLGPRVEFVPFCPEVAIGLGIPRPPIQLVDTEGEVRAQGVEDFTLDPTMRLREYGRQIAQQLSSISGFIFKARSPSCGVGNVVVRHSGECRNPETQNRSPDSGFRRNDEKREESVIFNTGTGLFAAEILKAHPTLPIAQETELETAAQCEAFFQRALRHHETKLPLPPGPFCPEQNGSHEVRPQGAAQGSAATKG